MYQASSMVLSTVEKKKKSNLNVTKTLEPSHNLQEIKRMKSVWADIMGMQPAKIRQLELLLGKEFCSSDT